jgi:NAD(P)-dependent dehydrogenase (short-subunit alcohol dehydrogenase family)
MQEFAGKTAVITRAGSGIGAGLARHAAKLGCQVVIADIDEDGLADTLVDIMEAGGDCLAWRTDVAKADDVAALADQAFDAFGHVDLLFNNAGVLVDGVCWERSLEDWRWSLDVNVMGCVHGLKSFLPRMIAQETQGAVVNTASVAGLLATGFLGPYTTTKHAIFALSEVLFNDLRSRRTALQAHVLCPGAVDTRIWESDRLRPKDETAAGGLQTQSEKEFRAEVSATLADGMSPDELAGIVFAAIAAERFHIFPHPEFLERARKRFARIVAQENPGGD